MITFEGNNYNFEFRLIDEEKNIGEVFDKQNNILYRGQLMSVTIDKTGGYGMRAYDMEIKFMKITEVKQ